MEVAGLIERLGKIISEGGPSPSDYDSLIALLLIY